MEHEAEVERAARRVRALLDAKSHAFVLHGDAESRLAWTAANLPSPWQLPAHVDTDYGSKYWFDEAASFSPKLWGDEILKKFREDTIFATTMGHRSAVEQKRVAQLPHNSIHIRSIRRRSG